MPGNVVERNAKDQSRNNRNLIGLKNISSHSGAVADIIADQVGHDGRVPGIILRDACFDLADQVSTYISSFGIYTTTDPHKESQKRTAEAEAEESVWRSDSKINEDQCPAQ
jgi:hypothetical protein